MTAGSGAARPGGKRPLGAIRFAALACALAAACSLGAPPAAAQDLEVQLNEIRTLIAEHRFTLALEGLRLLARQLQDQRLEAVSPAFPAPADGWTGSPTLNLLEEDEIWSDRIAARRSYVAPSGSARIDLTIDVHSPFVPAVALSFNPLMLAADPQARIQEVGGEKGLLRFQADTGEGELLVLVGREILVTARGRGIASPELLVTIARGVDYSLLRGKALQ
jgi:hypothetical protein